MKMLLYKTCFVLLLVVFAFKVDAQNNYIDSLKKVLQTEKEDTNKVNTLDYIHTYYWRADDYENTMQTAQKILALATKINYKIGIGDGYLNTGLAYGINKDTLNESEYFNKALAVYKETGDTQQILGCYGWMNGEYQKEGNPGKALEVENVAQTIRQQTGNKQIIVDGYHRLKELYILVNNPAKAFECVYAAQKIREQTGDKKTIADGFLDIASTFSNSGSNNSEEELKNELSALKIYKELNDKNGIGTISFMIGGVYSDEGKYGEALDKYAEALQILKDSGRLNLIANIYALIGDAYEGQGDSANDIKSKILATNKYLEAEKNQLISLRKWQAVPYRLAVAVCYSNLGKININLKNLSIAKKYLDSSLAICQSIGMKSSIGYIYDSYAKIDSIQGNYKEAYNNYRLFKMYDDSANNEEDAKKAVQVQMQYAFDKKEATTKAEQDKKDTDAKRIKNQQYFAIAALGIVVLAVIIIAMIQFRNNKQKQQANIALQHQKAKVESTLSELKSTQSQLIQSEKMASLGELTAGIAHEIQNPLNFVNNFSDVNQELLAELKEEADKGNIDEVKAIANDVIDNEQKINHHGKRADAIVKGMLQHSRKNTGIKEPTDINALCDEYLRLSYHGLRAKDKNFNADFKTNFDETIGKINIVAQDIGRVLLNLFNNAFYTTNERKKTADESYKPLVSVATKSSLSTGGEGRGEVEIQVSDNGNGIPQNITDKIFQPFFTTKPTGEGTGLGLSLSYDIIKAHGGEIKVETKEGDGSTFIIQLPIG